MGKYLNAAKIIALKIETIKKSRCQEAVNYMFKEGPSLHDSINLRQTFTQHTHTYTYTWEQNCVYLLQKRNLDRPSFFVCGQQIKFKIIWQHSFSVNCYFCVLLFVALCQTYKAPIRWFSFIVFLYCWVFLIAVFAANQLGLILWPSVFWSTSNIANLYNPPIGAMSWSGRITTKRKSSFSALVSFLFWHSFPFLFEVLAPKIYFWWCFWSWRQL